LSLSNGERLVDAVVIFDVDGSFAQVYSGQGSDEGFAAGLLGISIESDEYAKALKTLSSEQRPFDFEIRIDPLPDADHPNLVELHLTCESKLGPRLDRYSAVSIGGGAFQIRRCNGHDVQITGSTGVLLVELNQSQSNEAVSQVLDNSDLLVGRPDPSTRRSKLLQFATRRLLTAEERKAISCTPGVLLLREALPRQLLRGTGRPLFLSAQDIADHARRLSLPDLAVLYESALLDLPPEEIEKLFRQRAEVMLGAVEEGLARDADELKLKFLNPRARMVHESTRTTDLIGQPVSSAIAGALAVMELNTSRGLICAAPTAGSAGIVPGCLFSLQHTGHSADQIGDALKVASIIGAVVSIRATFAAELCGCMAETGVAAAMAGGGLTFIMGGSPEEVLNAASLCLMNTLGLICDPVHGEIEIPCHARNIAGVGNAFSSAASCLGGFQAVIPFDEVVDAMSSVGQAMPSELRCTSKGGLATTKTALSLSSRVLTGS
jgi:L-serine dehydratase